MWMTKYRSNYTNTLTHRHGCEIHINSDGFKRHDRFTNKVMFELSWNVTTNINTSDWKGLCKCLGAKFPGQKRVALGEGLLLALVRDLNGRLIAFLEKDLDAVVHESEDEIK